MKIYSPEYCEYIFRLRDLYSLKHMDCSKYDQKWLEKIDEMFYKKVSINLYSIYANDITIKYIPPEGKISFYLDNLLEDCYEIANDVSDLEQIKEKLKYFQKDLYSL